MSQGSVLWGMHKVTHDWGWEGWSFRLSLDNQVIRADFLSEESEKASKRNGILLRLWKVGKCGSTETRGRTYRSGNDETGRAQIREGRGAPCGWTLTWNMFFTLDHPQLYFYLGNSYSSFRPQQTSLPAIRLPWFLSTWYYGRFLGMNVVKPRASVIRALLTQ